MLGGSEYLNRPGHSCILAQPSCSVKSHSSVSLGARDGAKIVLLAVTFEKENLCVDGNGGNEGLF